LPVTASEPALLTAIWPPLRPLAATEPETETFAPAIAMEPPSPPRPPLAVKRPPTLTMPPSPPLSTILPPRVPTLFARMVPGTLTAPCSTFDAVAALR
jgi:hypothetical protein